MMLPTREDIEQCIKMMSLRSMDAAERLKGLLAFYDERGLPIGEVDLYLLGEVPGRKQLTQIHSFAVGDKYTLLPEDEEPVSSYYNYNLGDEPGVAEVDEVDGWKIQDIRAHVKKGE